MTATLDALASRLAAGEAVGADDARLLLSTPDLIAVGTVADDLRRRLRGSTTTFVRVLEFHIEAIPETLPPGTAPGEIRLVGDAANVEGWARAVATVRALAPGVPLSALTIGELTALAAGAGVTPEEASSRLAAAGLSALLGVVLDRDPDPAPAIAAARRSGLAVLRLLVAGGHAADPLAPAVAARDLQDRLGGFRAFAPLPREINPGAPTTGYDDVKLVAAARVVAANVPSIQVDWLRYGPKLAQVALTTGADDLDGVAAGPGTLGPRRSPLEEVRKNIVAAGTTPVERDGLFEPLAPGAGAGA